LILLGRSHRQSWSAVQTADLQWLWSFGRLRAVSRALAGEGLAWEGLVSLASVSPLLWFLSLAQWSLSNRRSGITLIITPIVAFLPDFSASRSGMDAPRRHRRGRSGQRECECGHSWPVPPLASWWRSAERRKDRARFARSAGMTA